MNLHRLIIFATVVEAGSVAEAARQLFFSQPAISKQIVALEETLGYQLFDRIGKKMQINKSGELVYVFAKQYQQNVLKLKKDLGLLNKKFNNSITFGANNYVGMYVIPPLLGKFKDQYPALAVNFSINFTPNILQLLDQGQIEFALLPESKLIYDKKYTIIPFFKDLMKLIMVKDHPLAKRNIIFAKDILDYPFLISRKESITREYVEKHLQTLNITLANIIDLHNSESIKQGVLKGIGISIIAQGLVKNEVAQNSLIQKDIEDLQLQRVIYIVMKKNVKLSSEATNFIQQLQESN